MGNLHVTFYSPLEELALKRTNQAIKNILNILDFANLENGDRAKLRKIVLDEINSMRSDFIMYFDNLYGEKDAKK